MGVFLFMMSPGMLNLWIRPTRSSNLLSWILFFLSDWWQWQDLKWNFWAHSEEIQARRPGEPFWVQSFLLFLRAAGTCYKCFRNCVISPGIKCCLSPKLRLIPKGLNPSIRELPSLSGKGSGSRIYRLWGMWMKSILLLQRKTPQCQTFATPMSLLPGNSLLLYQINWDG